MKFFLPTVFLVLGMGSLALAEAKVADTAVIVDTSRPSNNVAPLPSNGGLPPCPLNTKNAALYRNGPSVEFENDGKTTTMVKVWIKLGSQQLANFKFKCSNVQKM